jgi:undecaprenyl-diphosphatase
MPGLPVRGGANGGAGLMAALARVLQALRPLGEMRLLWALIVCGALLWGFLEIVDEVIEGESRAVDEWLMLALRSPGDPAVLIGPVWLEETVRDVTALGGYTVLGMVTVATAAGFWLAGRRPLAVFVVVTALGAVFWTESLKWFFDRPRPDLVPHGVDVHSQSFPSGHATAASAIYLTQALILSSYQSRRRVRFLIVATAVIVSLLVGCSRVLLGVHWPSDVAAGWTLGGAWALMCWILAAWLRERRVLPRATQSEEAAATTSARATAGGSSRVM